MDIRLSNLSQATTSEVQTPASGTPPAAPIKYTPTAVDQAKKSNRLFVVASAIAMVAGGYVGLVNGHAETKKTVGLSAAALSAALLAYAAFSD